MKVAEQVAKGSKVKIFIDVSTTGPEDGGGDREFPSSEKTSLQWTLRYWRRRRRAKATLAITVGCPKPMLERVTPILSALGKVFHLGEKAGAGQLMKLANNLLSHAALAVTSEVMVMGVKGGWTRTSC